MKIGPSLAPAELTQLVRVLNPHNEPGKLTLITRYGEGKVESVLPTHIAAVRARYMLLYCYYFACVRACVYVCMIMISPYVLRHWLRLKGDE